MFVFMIGSVVLFVLYVNALRTGSQARQVAPTAAPVVAASPTPYPQVAARSYTETIALPKAKLTGGLPLYQAIAERRTRREFSEKKVTQSELAQMLFSGQGMVDPAGTKRTIPSARESYPMTIYVVVRSVEGLEPGIYEYLPKTHALGVLPTKDLLTATKESGIQDAAQKSPVVFLVSAAIGNYQAKTKSLTTSATYLETGHIGQNLYLTAESLKMSTVVMAGFDSSKVTKAFGIDPAEMVQYVVPFGHRAPEKPVEE